MKSTKHFLLFIIALISINVNAQEAPPVTINVATAGTLPQLIASSKKDQITNLTLTGFLNGTDIRFIREMAGININRQSTNGKLSALDLSKAKIVSGGENYYEYDGSFYYSSSDTIGACTFLGCKKLTSITLPYSVTTIGKSAFMHCTGLTSITFPNNITKIDFQSFSGCTGLTSITIPNGVTTIESNAFSYCTALTSITIPNSVTTIRYFAFKDCTGLTSVTIPNSVTTIEDFAFYGCTTLEEFIVLDNNSVYKSIEGVLFSKDGTKLITYPINKSNTYSIPNGVTTIESNAFSYCTALTSITIPNSVITIESDAFYWCTGLTSVTIPNSVTTIESGAFSYCTGLTSITFPNNITKIDFQSFSGCTGLTSITIPNGVTSIDRYAFKDCTGLTSVTIPNSVKSISYYAFNNCLQIKQILCEGITPPEVNSAGFPNIYNTCTLYVPKVAYSTYWVSPFWGQFKNIIEQVTTSISDIEANKTNVYTENGYIVVKGGKLGDIINIYSVTGSLLHKIKITDDIVRISVAPQSLYIVKAGDKSFKIAL